jgi:hypothetical protein
VLDILAGSLVEVELISALEPAKLPIVVGAGGSVPFGGRRRVGIYLGPGSQTVADAGGRRVANVGRMLLVGATFNLE